MRMAEHRERGCAAGGFDDVLADVNRIQESAASAADLTRQLLVVARRPPGQPQLVDLGAVVRADAAVIARTVGGHVRLRVELAQDLPEALLEPSQAEQVLLNLVLNARDAMAGGGVLTVRTATVTVDADQARRLGELSPGRYVLLSVSDTGTGMPPQVAVRAFEPFFTTKALERGTGLGLATVHGAASAAGGTAVIDSEVGVGTTVLVYLPAATGERGSTARSAPPIERGGGETVLVLDGDQSVLRMVERLLTASGYEAVTAADVDGALRQWPEVADRVAVLMVSDVLPGMPTARLVRWLRAERPGLPVILASGAGPEPARQLDAVALAKPFSRAALLEALRTAMKRSGGAGPMP
jgi:two-component system, cell cycle sensor histidine kinase and response regulator CckA